MAATVNNILIMSRAWCEKHRTTKPQDFAHNEETYSARHMMGTGPYILEKFEAGVKSVYRKNPEWWGIGAGLYSGNIDTVEYRPIVNPATGRWTSSSIRRCRTCRGSRRIPRSRCGPATRTA
jgi:peptide/nickel transport system substrate-binding protein